MSTGNPISDAPRSYHSPLREERLRRTRGRIVAAAATLFTEQGYAGTTLDQVAAAAGVSRKTVADAVGGKAQLMKLAYDHAITGDDAPVPLADRAVIAALVAEPDPRRRVASYAALVVDVDVRIAGIWRALEGAAASDPEAARLHEALVRQRRTSMQGPASAMAADGVLRPGVGADEAADLMWFYNDPTVYDQLVVRRGWSVETFRDWLAYTLQTQLLGPEVRTA